MTMTVDINTCYFCRF